MIEGLRRGGVAFLASVTSAAEADIALQGGADIVDCKDPSRGALGALDAKIVRAIVARVAGRVPVSATIGDLPNEPRTLCMAATAMADTGVDIVKIGLFGDGDLRHGIRALSDCSVNAKLVAVLMADRQPDLSLVDSLARYGFAGVMLDTADKSSGSLTSVLPGASLASFVRRSESVGLCVGLAGSLRIDDIAPLANLEPHILGFRGALCIKGRTSAVDVHRVRLVRDALSSMNDCERKEAVA